MFFLSCSDSGIEVHLQKKFMLSYIRKIQDNSVDETKVQSECFSLLPFPLPVPRSMVTVMSTLTGASWVVEESEVSLNPGSKVEGSALAFCVEGLACTSFPG